VGVLPNMVERQLKLSNTAGKHSLIYSAEIGLGSDILDNQPSGIMYI
jgi:hypothetical protein